VLPNFEALPMGFETYLLINCTAQAVDFEALPMGFETFNKYLTPFSV